MLPMHLRKPGDFLLWKTNMKTREYHNIGGYTQRPDEDICAKNNTDPLNGYNHISLLDEDVNYLLHAHPPCASRDFISLEWWNKNFKRADAELWRFEPELSPEDASRMCRSFYEITNLKWNQKKGCYEGLKYDWTALFPIFAILGINKKHKFHCSEAVAESALRINRTLSVQGEYDKCVSPNNIINSNAIRKIWGEYAPIK